MGQDEDKRSPEYYSWLALVAGWQCVMNHGQNTPGVLQVRQHFPHRGVVKPLVQYLGIYECDRQEGRPVKDARDGIPVDWYLVSDIMTAGNLCKNMGDRNCWNLRPLLWCSLIRRSVSFTCNSSGISISSAMMSLKQKNHWLVCRVKLDTKENHEGN